MSGDPRIFHLITRLLRGGAERKTIQTVLGLDGYEFAVGHGAAFESEQVQRLESAGVPSHRFRTIRHYNPVTAVPAVGAVAAHLRRHDYDLVHTHATEAGIIGRLAANLAGVPAIHTVHGVPFTTDRNPLLNRFVLAAERAVAPRTAVIVTNADAIATDYLDRGIGRPDQYTTVYSGIDIDRYASATPAGDLPGSGTRLTFVGRLVEGKGLWDLLDAVERLDRDDVTLTVVGEGPLASTLEDSVRARDLPVHVLGYREDVPAVLAASDVFVLPSYREGTPRVITEAMAAGLPVVATDIAGVPEQVADGENGYLVEPGDIDALVERLERLLADPDRRATFGQASRDRVGPFSESGMLEALDGVYRDVLER